MHWQLNYKILKSYTTLNGKQNCNTVLYLPFLTMLLGHDWETSIRQIAVAAVKLEILSVAPNRQVGLSRACFSFADLLCTIAESLATSL